VISDGVDRGLWFLELCRDTGGLDNDRTMPCSRPCCESGLAWSPRSLPGPPPSRHVPATPVGEVSNGCSGRRRRSPIHSGPHRRRGFASACPHHQHSRAPPRRSCSSLRHRSVSIAMRRSATGDCFVAKAVTPPVGAGVIAFLKSSHGASAARHAHWSGHETQLGGSVRERPYGRATGIGAFWENVVGQAVLDDGLRARACSVAAPATCPVALRARIRRCRLPALLPQFNDVEEG
jgi:hypothetical protein